VYSFLKKGEIVMPEQGKKKSLLDKAVDALTDRDEKAAAAEAAQKAAEAEKKVIEAEKKVAEAKAKMEQMEKEEKERKRKEMLEEAQKNWAEENARQKAAAAAAAEAAKPKIIKEHTMTAEETLSHLSLKYYGSAVRDYWMVIYEANKDVIGDNPAHVRPGLVVKIPELPENLKKK
jgi:nucleoid-associated protein YgaU